MPEILVYLAPQNNILSSLRGNLPPSVPCLAVGMQAVAIPATSYTRQTAACSREQGYFAHSLKKPTG